MTNDCNTKNPLQRDGTSQQQRLLKALLPSYVSVDERSMQDLMDFAAKFGEEIKYYDLNNSSTQDPVTLKYPDWTSFFTNQLIDETNQTTQPHYALFIAFLELFQIAQNDLNTITKRHLDFYYKEVLKFNERDAIPDQVFVIFELAQNVVSHLVAKGNQLDAGKDSTGTNLIYETTKDIVVNNAQVQDLKALFFNKANDRRLYASPVANSANGEGAELEGDEKKWRTFGAISDPAQPFTSPLADREQAEVGFAFASPNLLMAEGERIVTFILNLADTTGFNDSDNFRNAFSVFFSGEKGWIEPVAPALIDTYMHVSKKYILIRRTITSDKPAIVPYDPAVLNEPFKTEWPVAKIVLNTADISDPYIYEKLKGLVLVSAQITTAVSGVKNLILQNDLSTLDASKPFQPFGNRPVLGSSFYIGSSEVFGKTLTSVNINISWLGLPKNGNGFSAYYHDYLPADENSFRTNNGFRAGVSILESGSWRGLMDPTQDASRLFNTDGPNSSDAVGPLISARQVKLSGDILSSIKRDINLSRTPLSALDNKTANGFLRLQLANVDFGHGDFQNSFSTQAIKAATYVAPAPSSDNSGSSDNATDVALADCNCSDSGTSTGGDAVDLRDGSFPNGCYCTETECVCPEGGGGLTQSHSSPPPKSKGGGNTPPQPTGIELYPLPNEPYTPTIGAISIDYTSSVIIQLSANSAANTPNGYNNRQDLFFHVEPFGVAEYHPFIIKNTAFIPLLPVYNDEGTLYIGLKDLTPGQTLSVLFKMAEGTSDPDLLKQAVNWSYLVNNEWKSFSTLQVVSDTTSGFLTSGIVVLDVPKAITLHNTLFTDGLYWVKAAITNDSLSACETIDIRTQATTALYVENNNDPNHLLLGLPPNSIKGLLNSDPAIKAVDQPYSSFGGKIQEQSNDFYTRVSERLRHKNRSVNIWDYEHLVLEKFPSIYKAKCLNHTRFISGNDIHEIAPGHVSLIMVSDVRNKNAVNPLQPKTSLVLLNSIQEYVQALCPPYLELHIKNPIYEEIMVDFSVRFFPGFDSGFYSVLLEGEIKKFLAPWAYSVADISFGGKIHKSVILNFVEEREYVDFVTCFKMHQITPEGILTDITEAVAVSSASILTSAKSHKIKVLEGDDCECVDNDVTAPFEPVDEGCDCVAANVDGALYGGIGVFGIQNNFIVGNGIPIAVGNNNNNPPTV